MYAGEDTCFKVDLAKAQTVRAMTQPSHTGGQSRRAILVQPICFLIPYDILPMTRDDKRPPDYSGPQAWVLVRRTPRELFDGLCELSPPP